jgi:hypothetical protein
VPLLEDLSAALFEFLDDPCGISEGAVQIWQLGWLNQLRACGKADTARVVDYS